MNDNLYSEKETAKILTELLVRKGVRRVLLSPGSRNAPLIISLTRRRELSCRVVLDERVAAYMAVGMAQQSGEAVALVCTSGTALLNYAPAVAEAFYQHLPLIVISADRPEEWIDQDDSQTIRQYAALAPFVKASYRLPAELSCADERWYANRLANEALNTALALPQGPVHLDVPFREPLYGIKAYPTPERTIEAVPVASTLPDAEARRLASMLSLGKRVLIVASFAAPDAALVSLLTRAAAFPQVVLLTESLANLPVAEAIPTIDRVLSVMPADRLAEYRPDILITFGGALVSRRLKRFLRENRPEEHWRLDAGGHIVDTMQSLTRHIRLASSDFFAAVSPYWQPAACEYRDLWRALREEAARRHDAFLSSAAWSDLTAFSLLMPALPAGAAVQLSNGMTVRYAQLFEYPQVFRSDGNRGTSGIDGSLSTAVGAAIASNRLTVCIIGDMSFLYDAAALATGDLPPNLRIVVICNGGGGIFRTLAGVSELSESETCFETVRRVDVEGYARLHGIDFYRAADAASLRNLLPRFFQETGRVVILAIETPRLLNAEVLKAYFSR